MRVEGKKIDFEDLEKQLMEKGYSNRSASIAMGYTKNAISNAKSRGNMTIPMINLLRMVLGIKVKEIEDAAAEEETVGIDYYDVIYNATYNGITDALKDLLERIH